MNIKEAMKIVAYNVIVKGDEEIELALQTVENELGLDPVISHGNGEPFHYTEQEVTPLDAANYFTPDAMAECMDGVSDELNQVLWKVVSDYEKDFGVKEYEEPIDMNGDLSLAAMWGKFTNDQRAQINDILTKNENG